MQENMRTDGLTAKDAADEQGRRSIEEKIALDAPISREQFTAAVKGAIQARSTLTYLLWKELGEVLGKDEATALMGRVYRRFGQINGEAWGEVADAASALLAQSSKGGFLVFEQELDCAGPDCAQKTFHACPHVEAFKKLGATDEEIRTLCQDILSEGDYGNLDPHDGIELEFKKQRGAGDDCCVYRLTRTDEKHRP